MNYYFPFSRKSRYRRIKLSKVISMKSIVRIGTQGIFILIFYLIKSKFFYFALVSTK